MAEFGIIVPQGIQRMSELVAMFRDETPGIPRVARQALAAAVVQIDDPRRASGRWAGASLPVVAPMHRRGGLRSFPASVLSPPRPWPPRSRTRRCFDLAAILQHGSAWYGASARPAEGQARQDQQDGRPAFAQAADRLHDGGDPLCAAHQCARLRLGQCAARAASGAPGLGRSGQPGDAHHLDSLSVKPSPRSPAR